MRAYRTIVAIVTAVTVSVAPASGAVKPGAKCTTSGRTQNVGNTTFTCTKVGKQLVWKAIATRPSPAPTPTPSPTPSTTSTPTPIPNVSYAAYTGGAGPGGANAAQKSAELPAGINPSGTGNVRLWFYDPENPTRALATTGFFRQAGNGPWAFTDHSADGSYVATWPAGEYNIDGVEPRNDQVKYSRHRYILTVAADGSASVEGLLPNSKGFFTLTIDLVPPATPFTPANVCQLERPKTVRELSVAFPHNENRLRTTGTIRALFVPVAFTDLAGNGDPLSLFRNMATGMDTFYNRASNGAVRFDFKVYPTWLQLGFSSTKYELGSYNGGNPNGYFAAAIRAADSVVDYSQFDVVYFLSPTNIPWKSIAYGPGIQQLFITADGPIRNGTFSGADAYQNLPGADWKWASHETGHLFGMYDLYTLDVPATYGSWDLMSLNWSREAIELNAWNRFTQGWLAESQYKCLDVASLPTESAALVPIASSDAGLKSVIIRLSSTKVLVIEYRKTAGLDVIPAQHEGILVYTVDTTIDSIKGGFKTQRRPGSTADDFTDAALRPGDVITVQGVRIEVPTANTVKVSRA